MPQTAAPRASLWPFAAVSASYFAHIGFFNPYLPLWLQDMGLSLLAIGVLAALPSATRLFAPYVWAWLSDHSGRRVGLLRYCAAAAAVVSVVLWWPWPAFGVAAVLLLLCAHTSAITPLSETLLLQQVSGSGRLDVRRYGRVRVWGSLAFLLAVLLAGVWFDRYGMANFPQWVTLTLLLMVGGTWLIAAGRDAPVVHVAGAGLWHVLQRAPVRWFLLSLFLHVLAHSFVYVFFSLYMHELGYSKAVIGLLWACGVLGEMAWFLTQSRWLTWLTLPHWAVLSSGVLLLRLGVVVALPGQLGLLFVAQATHAITFAAHHAVCIAMLRDYFAGHMQARGQALYSVVGYGLTGVAAGLSGGWVSHHWGLAAVFGLATAVAVLALLAAAVSARFQRPNLRTSASSAIR